MARIELAPEVADDFDRILEHLREQAVEAPVERLREILDAVDVLERNPLIGRPGRDDQRELVIGRRSHGYVALYRYLAELDAIFVLAIRQREAGFTRD